MPTWEQVPHSLGPADESEDSQDESNDASSESSEEAHEGGFFDTMAAEGSEDEESEDDSEIGFGASHPDPEFPQFLKLPIELRRHIWELYCPELRLKPRMMDFTINPGTARHRDPSWSPAKQVWTVTDGIMLADMTSATRTVLSVHAESRSMALAVLTDTLAIEAGSGDALVRFNPEKDLVKISGLSPRDYRAGDYLYLDGFADKVKNLSLSAEEAFRDGISLPNELSDELLRFETMTHAFLNLLDKFKNIETVFFGATHRNTPSDDEKSRKRRLRWCASDLVNHHFIETHELVDGYGENLQYIFCWPDLISHKDFAKTSVDKLWCDEESMPKEFSEYFEHRNIGYWPVVIFEAGKGRRRYESLFQEPDFDFTTSDSDDWSDHSLATDPHLDAYESDGIDDAEVLETFDDSDDGDLSDADRRLGGLSSENGSVIEGRFSSPEAGSGSDESAVIGKRGELSDVDAEDAVEGRFSSPEADSDAAPSPPVNRGRKRRIVSDSDDEEEATEEPASKRPRMACVVLSDSEDEPVLTQQTSGSNRSRGRQVLSDSDDDDDEDEGGAGVAPAVEKKTASSDDEDDSDPEESDQASDSSDDSDEDEKPPPQLSLAERLRLHRETNPVSDDGNDSSGTVDVDDDEEDDESDDEDDESGLLLRMADDGSGSEDDEDEEDGYNY
jgi:hypothetical protein